MIASFFRRATVDVTRPVRVGILIESHVPALFIDVLEDVAQSNFAQISCVIATRASRPPCSTLLRLYEHWDEWRYRDEEPFRSVDPSRALAGIPVIHLTPPASDGAAPEILRQIAAADLDVILATSEVFRKYTPLLATRQGIWSYRFGDGPEQSSSLAYLRELMSGSALMQVRLVRWGAQPSHDLVLWEAAFAGPPSGGISLRQARSRPGWGCTSAFIQKLRDLHDRPPRVCAPVAPVLGAAEIPTKRVSNTEVFGWLAPQIVNKAIRRMKGGSSPEHWRMAVRTGDRQLWGDRQPDTSDFRWIESPPGHFYADPFLIRRNDRTWLFYEHFQYSEQRAVIDCAELLADGTLSESHLALRRGYHLSFPQVFQYGGEFFMLPETAGNNTIELYRAVRFPSEWTLEKVLVSGISAVDTALWNDGDFWWFFSTLKEPRGNGFMLFLFFSRTLTGEWQSHPCNPICTDVRYARGAGSVFQHNGRILRPNQDCSIRYGYRLNCHEVTTLTPQHYAERPLFTLDPSAWTGLIGVHTYNRCAGAEAVDGCIATTMVQTGGYKTGAIAPADRHPES